MIDQLKPLMGKLCTFAKDRMGFKHPPKLFLKSDAENSQMALGRTAHYDPDKESITLYITNRHPKDILRSLAHELVHHTQNLRGDLAPEKMGDMGKNYAQDNDHMRNMEKEAYLQGNMCFRDWEDGLDNKELFIIKLAESNFLKQANKEKKPVNIKELKETIRQVVEAAVGANSQKDGDDSDVENEGPYIDGERTKAGIDDDGDGVPNSVDPEPKDGAIPAKSKAKKSNIKKENKSMTTKITKEFLEETIRDLLQKEISEQTSKGQAGRDLANAVFNNDQEALQAADAAAGDQRMIYRGTKKVKVADLKTSIAKIRKQNKLRQDNISLVKSFYEDGFDEKLQPFGGKDLGRRHFSSLEDAQAYIANLEKLVSQDKERANRMERLIAKGGSDPKKAAAMANKGVLGVMSQMADNEEEPLDVEDALKKAASRSKGQKGLEETSVGTPEKENALYEQRFTGKNTKLFEKLVKEWTK